MAWGGRAIATRSTSIAWSLVIPISLTLALSLTLPLIGALILLATWTLTLLVALSLIGPLTLIHPLTRTLWTLARAAWLSQDVVGQHEPQSKRQGGSRYIQTDFLHFRPPK